MEDLDQFGVIGVIDRTLAISDRVTKDVPRQNYHLVLQACTQLGMIAGRRVPNPAEPIGVTIGRKRRRMCCLIFMRGSPVTRFGHIKERWRLHQLIPLVQAVPGPLWRRAA